MSQNDPTPITVTTHIVAPEKSVIFALLLTFFFGPLGLLYATVGGGIFMIIVAMIVGTVTLGVGALITWPVAMVWAVFAALASKHKPSTTA